jgi:hypothetical protein
VIKNTTENGYFKKKCLEANNAWRNQLMHYPQIDSI